MEFKFAMNQVVKDVISGFQGVILARVEYATGCKHYGIAPQSVNKDGKISEWEYLDESRLMAVGTDVKLNGKQGKDPFGPCENPPQW